MLTVTLPQARQFILLKQGLLGDYRFIRKDGAYQYVRQAGCIQFDPVDVCGRNAELTLQSRVKGFRKRCCTTFFTGTACWWIIQIKSFPSGPARTGPSSPATGKEALPTAGSSPVFLRLKSKLSTISGSMVPSAVILCP